MCIGVCRCVCLCASARALCCRVRCEGVLHLRTVRVLCKRCCCLHTCCARLMLVSVWCAPHVACLFGVACTEMVTSQVQPIFSTAHSGMVCTTCDCTGTHCSCDFMACKRTCTAAAGAALNSDCESAVPGDRQRKQIEPFFLEHRIFLSFSAALSSTVGIQKRQF